MLLLKPKLLIILAALSLLASGAERKSKPKLYDQKLKCINGDSKVMVDCTDTWRSLARAINKRQHNQLKQILSSLKCDHQSLFFQATEDGESTLLHIAVESRNNKALKSLLESKAEVIINHRNKTGKTPLDMAIEMEGLERWDTLASLLINHGAYVPKNTIYIEALKKQQSIRKRYDENLAKKCLTIIKLLQSALAEQSQVSASKISGIAPKAES